MSSRREISAHLSRRRFLSGSAAGLGAALLGARALRGAEEKVHVGYIGVGGRGTNHLNTMLQLPGVEVTWVCDIDPSRLENAARLVEGFLPVLSCTMRAALSRRLGSMSQTQVTSAPGRCSIVLRWFVPRPPTPM